MRLVVNNVYDTSKNLKNMENLQETFFIISRYSYIVDLQISNILRYLRISRGDFNCYYEIHPKAKNAKIVVTNRYNADIYTSIRYAVHV